MIALLLILCIAGVSVLAWQATKNKPAHQAPTALGGSANERPGAAAASSSAAGASASGGGGASGTVKHVSPTHTVARRSEEKPTAMAIPLGHTRATAERRKRLFNAVVA